MILGNKSNSQGFLYVVQIESCRFITIGAGTSYETVFSKAKDGVYKDIYDFLIKPDPQASLFNTFDEALAKFMSLDNGVKPTVKNYLHIPLTWKHFSGFVLCIRVHLWKRGIEMCCQSSMG